MNDEELHGVVKEECKENLQSMEELLLEVDKGALDQEMIDSIFRTIHNVKSGVGILGLENISEVAHRLENILDEIRQSEQPQISREVLNLLFSGVDLLKQVMESEALEESYFLEQAQKLLNKLDSYEKGDEPVEESPDMEEYGETGIAGLVRGFNREYINNANNEGKGICRVQVKLRKDCMMKSVRAYMVVKALSEVVEIIEISPRAEELEEEKVEEDFYILVSGENLDYSVVKEKLQGISEVEGVEVSDIDLDKGLEIFEHETGPAAFPSPEKKTDVQNRYFRIEINIASSALKAGLDPLMFMVELEEVGKILESYANMSDLPALEDLDPTCLHIYWTLFMETPKTKQDLESLFALVPENSKILIEDITGEADLWFKDDKKVGELLVERGLVSPEDIETVLQKQKRIGEMLVEEGKLCSGQVEKVLQKQEDIRGKSDTIRVDSQKLDNILNNIAELLIAQSSIKSLVYRLSDNSRILHGEIENAFQETDKIIRRLQEDVMKTSMIPIGSTFLRMQRLVRDMTEETGKEVEMVVGGKDTELDKKVIEDVADPLKHLLRNAVDHGLETPQERRRKGKDASGTIHLNAYHREGSIVIEISDDGKGIDCEAVWEKALERGIVNSGDRLSEEEIQRLIFVPGFSTAGEVTERSGRGVGLDVVMDNLKKMSGDIEVSSEKGAGTTFKIKLPLTQAIIDGMMVRVGEERLIIPLSGITEFIKAEPESVRQAAGKGLVLHLRREYIPVAALYQLFKLKPEFASPSEGILVILQEGHKKMALLVDEIIGQEQVVIKSIKDQLEQAEGIAGATILGDGKVSLILDTVALFRMSKQNNCDYQYDYAKSGDAG